MYMEGCYEKIGGPTRPSRSTRASSESANTAEVNLLKDSGCLAVLSAGPGKKFLLLLKLNVRVGVKLFATVCGILSMVLVYRTVCFL